MEEAAYGSPFHPSMGYNDQQLPPTTLVDNFMISSSDLHTIFAAATTGRIGFSTMEADPMAASPISSTVSMVPEVGSERNMESSIKARIASHPRYPRLLEAYIDCQKVGAPPEIASLLDEIRQETHFGKATDAAQTTHIGADPELDYFMETYCDILVKYKLDLAGPFDEATSFMKNIELQLGDLCKGVSRSCTSTDDPAGSSEEEFSAEDMEAGDGALPRSEGGRELKDKLLRKYSGYLCSLKQEFSKKKKKGKLPKEARQTLLDWWNLHYKWPYPTEADKIALAETTGLDQKQINNWFINQRKRHWKPAENMQFAVVDGVTGPFSMDG